MINNKTETLEQLNHIIADKRIGLKDIEERYKIEVK